MVQISPIALALAVFSGSVLSLPQPLSAPLLDLYKPELVPAFQSQPPFDPQALEKRATTTTTKKTSTTSSVKKTSSTTSTKKTSTTSSAPKTTTTTTPKTTSTTSSAVKTTSSSTSVSKTSSTTSSARPSVTNTAAFTNGAGNKNNAQGNDGTGKAADDSYHCYYGGWQNFPPESKWLSFSTMFNFNKGNFYNACSNLGYKTGDDNLTQIQQIYQGIQTVAEESFVDHRFILAVIIQESLGCVYVGTTESPDGSTPNPGLMQSHNGTTYNVNDSANSILQMIRDGTEGTKYGDGLVQLINKYGNIYEAARGYNSGSVNSADLNDGFNATATYVADIANRLTGWLYADRAKC